LDAENLRAIVATTLQESEEKGWLALDPPRHLVVR
jgi:hypothetical protein